MVLAEDGGIVLHGWDIRNNILDARENDGSNIPGARDDRALPLGIRNAVGLASDYNVLVPNASGYVVSFGKGDGVRYSLRQYQEISKHDGHSSDQPPQFMNIRAMDYRVQSSSAAATMGDTALQGSVDINGILFGENPSVGAFAKNSPPLSR